MAGILLPYQRRWVEDKARFKIGMFSRQTGKTFSTTLECVDDCIAAEVAKRRARWVILSRGERQAAEAMEEGVKLHLRAYGAAYDALEYDFPADGARIKALEISLPGGSRITALPANPDTARGYSANVFLDEFAIHKDSRAIWGALFPVVSKAGLKLRVTSTPQGKGNKFYELWTADDRTWSRHRVDIHQAVAEGLDRDIGELKAGLADDELWRQEYELEFLDGAGAWLSYDLILAAEHGEAGDPARYQGGPCLIGNDIARRRDLWVAWVWERVGDVLWTREIVELRGATFAAQDAEIERLMQRYRVERLVMDQTGMGEKPVEDAQRRYGYLVEGVVLNGTNRLGMATRFRQGFEDRRLRIPAGRADLRADLHQIKRVVGDTGAPRLVAEHEGGSHADRFWAGCLGIAGASDQPAILTYYERLAAAKKAAEANHQSKEARHGQ